MKAQAAISCTFSSKEKLHQKNRKAQAAISCTFSSKEKLHQKNRKAQAVISFVISTVIFLFLLIYVVQSTLDWINPIFIQSQENEREVIAESILSLLVKQPGAWTGGANWESFPSKTTRLGLASNYMILSSQKISALEELEPVQIQSLLGPKYNYRICAGENCNLAEVRTTPYSTPSEKFAEGIFLDQSGKKTKIRVTVQ